MPPKRKARCQPTEDAKRPREAWKMMEDADAATFKQTDVIVIEDDEPSTSGMGQRSGIVYDVDLPTAHLASLPPDQEETHDYSNTENARELIRNCDFHLAVHQNSPVSPDEWSCLLGEFTLQFHHKPRSLPATEQFRLHISRNENKHLVYYELESEQSKKKGKVQSETKAEKRGKHEPDREETAHWEVTTSVPCSCLKALRLKAFTLHARGYNLRTGGLQVGILLGQSGVTALEFSSEPARTRTIHHSLQLLMSHFHGFTLPDDGGLALMKEDIEVFYDAVKQRHLAEDVRVALVDPQHPSLRPVLRPYQREAVTWMLEKERYGETNRKSDDELSLHCLYKPFTTLDGQLLYYNHLAGILVCEKPPSRARPPGGILADEMGLGKTVEVLSCILCHPRLDSPPPVLQSACKLGHPACLKAPNEQDGEVLKTIAHKPSSDEQSEWPMCSTSGKSAAVRKQKAKVSKPKVAQDRENANTELDQIPAKRPRRESARTRARERKLTSETTVPRTFRQKVKSKVEPLPGMEPATSKTSIKQKISAKMLKIVPEMKKELRRSSRIKRTADGSCVAASRPSEKKEDGPKSRGARKGVSHLDEEVLQDNISSRAQEEFECICGDTGAKTKLSQIQCEKCLVWQHAKCLNYDTEDPLKAPYLCPHCHVSARPIPSGATLIITPSSISYQWLQEISKHIHNQQLKVFMYTGVHKQGFIQPQSLASYDIVVTTYETLRKEIDYVDLPHCRGASGRRLRNPKKFMTIPSPMVAVEWWRVCLDEAQMVECTTTRTAEMALRLRAINRWCVTGTPIQQSINDLYGLLLFLDVDPYWVYHWWEKLLYLPYCHGNTTPMLDVMSQVLWRTVKKDVIDQIELPAQTEVKHWLTFSPVEEHFYRQQLNECTRTTIKNLREWTDCSVKLSSLDRNTLHMLLHPLTRLRQACCHPQVVRGHFTAINKSMMTMEDLLVLLTNKARSECQAAHRKLLSAESAIAGLHIIRTEYAEAAERYRNVLRSIEEYNEKFHTDKLQLLHTVHNLNEVVTSYPDVVPPAPQDDQLHAQALEIRSEYLFRREAAVKAALESWMPVMESLRELQQQFTGNEDWWTDLLHWISRTGLNHGGKFLDKVEKELPEDEALRKVQSDELEYIPRFADMQVLHDFVRPQLEQLQTSHDALVTDIQNLLGDPSRERITTTASCCIRPDQQTLKICEFCVANKKFDDYETKLFWSKQGSDSDEKDGENSKETQRGPVKKVTWADCGADMSEDEEGMGSPLRRSKRKVVSRRRVMWADSEVETVLKSLITFVSSYRGHHRLIEKGRLHLQIMDTLKNEFKCLRTLWLSLLEHVQAHDELDMATMRLRLRSEEDEVEAAMPDGRMNHIIEPAQVETLMMTFRADHTLAVDELRKKLSQLRYLENLAKDRGDSEEDESCPICVKDMGTRWSVLQCGHCFCMGCMPDLLSNYSSGPAHEQKVICPMCRDLTAHIDIANVSTREAVEETSKIPIKGDHSTKVDGVIRCLLQIHQDEPDAKTLVFSTWTDVLSILEKALDDNDIKYCSLMGANKFQEELWSFKNDAEIRVLLMTVHAGAKGLNLTEATHVILVEPILNPSQELQAIGRIHRIGQTKPTTVHRFLVQGTIEERMYSLQQTVRAPVNGHNAEESNMTIGDLTSLFKEMASVEEKAD